METGSMLVLLIRLKRTPSPLFCNSLDSGKMEDRLANVVPNEEMEDRLPNVLTILAQAAARDGATSGELDQRVANQKDHHEHCLALFHEIGIPNNPVSRGTNDAVDIEPNHEFTGHYTVLTTANVQNQGHLRKANVVWVRGGRGNVPPWTTHLQMALVTDLNRPIGIEPYLVQWESGNADKTGVAIRGNPDRVRMYLDRFQLGDWTRIAMHWIVSHDREIVHKTNDEIFTIMGNGTVIPRFHVPGSYDWDA